MLKKFFKSLGSFPKEAICLSIRGYQIFISPLFAHRGGGCRFYPTCSDYALQAIERFGILKGMVLGLKRIVRCHPWHQGGCDPVPDELNLEI